MEFDRIFPWPLEQIEQVLPHGRRFLFINQILEVEYGKRAVGVLSNFTQPEHEWIKDHFPGNEVVPGAILFEAIAEVGGIAILGSPENLGKIAIPGKIESLYFRRRVNPGDLVIIETEVIRLRSGSGRIHGRALLNNQDLAADGIINFAIKDKSSF